MGRFGMVLSAAAVVAGAIMYWAVTAPGIVTVQNHGFRLSAIGVILMIAGAAGFVTSLGVFLASRRAPAEPPRTLDREVVDTMGNRTRVHEQSH
jgi:hypothetical protein